MISATDNCTYDFFEQCQHRMACANCDFYMPKDSTETLLLEGKTHLLRLLQEIPLGEAEQAAVEDGIAAYENLLSKLVDVPTPAGPTPHQIGAELVQIMSSRQVAMPVAQDGAREFTDDASRDEKLRAFGVASTPPCPMTGSMRPSTSVSSSRPCCSGGRCFTAGAIALMEPECFIFSPQVFIPEFWGRC